MDIKIKMEARFVEGPSGRVFVTSYYPQDPDPTGAAVLICPPFGEELNKSRWMLAEQCRRLARLGCRVWFFDLYGTGDSDGDFRDATWAAWKADMQFMLRAINSQATGPIYVLACRTGALLATAVVSDNISLSIRGIVFWQPIFDGSRFLRTLLRLRVVADNLRGGNQSNVKLLMQHLADGNPLEVGGYWINTDLAVPLAAARLNKGLDVFTGHIAFLEVSASVGRAPSRAIAECKSILHEKCQSVVADVCSGDQFWATSEIGKAEPLLAKTVEVISDWVDRD